MKKLLYILLGCVGLGIGAVGAVIAMLPAFPFLILDHIPIVLILHRAFSIALVFFLAIHIFVFRKNYANQSS